MKHAKQHFRCGMFSLVLDVLLFLDGPIFSIFGSNVIYLFYYSLFHLLVYFSVSPIQGRCSSVLTVTMANHASNVFWLVVSPFISSFFKNNFHIQFLRKISKQNQVQPKMMKRLFHSQWENELNRSDQFNLFNRTAWLTTKLMSYYRTEIKITAVVIEFPKKRLVCDVIANIDNPVDPGTAKTYKNWNSISCFYTLPRVINTIFQIDSNLRSLYRGSWSFICQLKTTSSNRFVFNLLTEFRQL